MRDQKPTGASHHRIITPRGIDVDSIEAAMNRRLRAIWVRHTWFVVGIGALLFAGLVGVSVFVSLKPTELRIAAGPPNGDGAAFVEKLARRLNARNTGIRVEPVVKDAPVTVGDIHGRPEFDLAVVRGNMPLSSDWPVVAILRQNVVALIVPPAAARAPAPAEGKRRGKGEAAAPKLEKVADLAGRRIGIVASTDGGQELLNVILNHYGVPLDKVQAVPLALDDVRDAVRDRRIDAVLVSGPQTGKVLEKAVQAASFGKEGPSFIEIDQAEGIGKRNPPYEKIEVSAGAFGGVPPSPSEDLTTLSYPLYLVARRTFDEDKIAAFSKLLYTSRQALAYDLPGSIAISSPPTDKDSAVLVHAGAAAYLGDNQKTFFDRYGDAIFYGLLVFPVIGSCLAGIAGYFRADKNTRRIRELHRLLQLVRKARSVDAIEELDALQDEADAILCDIVQQTERGQIDEIGLATFTLALDQARAALSEQRSVLVLRPENVPRHHEPLPRGKPSLAAE